MTMISVNGWRVLVRDGGASAERLQHGAPGRSRTGRPLRSRAGSPRSWDLETVPMVAEQADALAALLEGRGHHFPFDLDAHSDGGLGPDTAASGNWSIAARTYGPTGAGVLGAGYLSVTTSITWDVQLPRGKWTIAYWRMVGSAATREHVIVRSDLSTWRDGDVAYVSTPELVIDEDLGAVALTAGSYDDLVILPFVAPDDLCDAIWRWTTRAGLLFSVPLLDGTARDWIGLQGSGPTVGGTASVLRHGGRPAGCILADAASEVVTFPASDTLCAYGRDEVTFEASVFPLSASTAGTVLDHVTGSAGWRLELLAASPTGRIGVRARVWTTAGAAEQRTSASDTVATLTANAHHHLLATWNRTAGVVQLYVDGTPIARVTGYFTDQAGADAADDSTATMRIGNQASGSAYANARISDVRFYERALSASEARARYTQWLDGAIENEWRPFSAMPRLLVDGEAMEHRTVLVAPEVLEQPLVQMPFAQSIGVGPPVLIIMEVGVADAFAVEWEPHVSATVAVATGSLPPGMTLSASTGIVSGTPNASALVGGNGGLGIWEVTFTITIGGEVFASGQYVVEVRGTELPVPTHHFTYDTADVIGGLPFDNYGGAQLSPTGGVTYGATGARGQAAEFDGVNDLENNTTISKSQTFSWAVDVYVDDVSVAPDGRQMVLNQGVGGTTWRGWAVSVRPDGRVRFTIEGGTSGTEEYVDTITDLIVDTTWATLVGRFETAVDTWSIMVGDQKSERTDAPSTAISYSAAGLVVGQHDYYNDSYLNGRVDSLVFWIGTVLTDAQAATCDWLRQRGTTVDAWIAQYHQGDLTFDAPGTQTPTTGVPFTFTPTYADTSDLTPEFFRVSGTLPPGLTLTQATGVISGTPTTPGTYTPTIRCTDGPRVVDRVITFIVS